MRHLLVLAVVALFSGCICCGGKDISLPGLKETPQTAGEECSAPYIRVGSDCCLDENGNGICDSDETTQTTEAKVDELQPTEITETSAAAPTTTQASASEATTIPAQTTQTTNPPTTTTQAMSQCADCIIMSLGSGWQEFRQEGGGTGYLLRFDGKEGSGQSLKYWIEVKTPDGITDRRPISTGESFIDYLRFKVVNYGEDAPKISIKVNTEDLAALVAQHPDASLLTVGGQSCASAGGFMCERNYKGYNIRMISRFGSGGENTASLWVTPPGTASTKIKVPQNGVASADGTLIIGGFFDNSHFIQGGYNLFYVYTL